MIQWKIKKIPVVSLKEYKGNPRTLMEKGMEDLKKSIVKFGFPEPIVVNPDFTIIGGHARKKTLEALGIKTVAVMIPERKLTKIELKELNIRLNKNIAGSFDFDILANNYEMEELIDWGFEEEELIGLDFGGAADEEKLDDVPEVQKKAISKTGDLFLLDSKHRVLCGDSTKKEDVEKLMGGEKANLFMGSPPYWVGKDYETEKSEDEINGFIYKAVLCIIDSVANDYSRVVINTGTCRATSLKTEKKTRVILLLDKWINEFYARGWYLRYIRNWIKGGGNARPRRPIDDVVYSGIEYLLTFYNINGESRGQNRLAYKWMQQSDWTDISGDRQENKAGYPVELPQRYIELYTIKDEIVIDSFSGNGTTLIACQQTKRICYGMEIDPIYIDVILKRYRNLYPDAEIKCLNRKFNFKKLFGADNDKAN